MNEPVFVGVGAALVTFFDHDGNLDADMTAEHAARLVDRGIRAIVVAGSTGEAACLDGEERDKLLNAVRQEVAGRVPVLIGTGAPSARQAVELVRRAVDGGADGLLVLSPQQSDDPRPYYEAVCDAAAGTPVLAYHYPDLCAPGIPIEAIADLPVQGLKDSTGDAERLVREVEILPRGLYTGSSSVLALAGVIGCSGAILAHANVYPVECIHAFGGSGIDQVHLVARSRRDGTTTIAGIKRLLHNRFGTSPTTRLC